MNSRYVLTKRPLEAFEVDGAPAEDILLDDAGFGPKKAKYRHGFSSPSALDVESTTPQVQRESVIFVAQVLASMSWIPGFLDVTQAFHSGDKIATECIVVKLQKASRHPPQSGIAASQDLLWLNGWATSPGDSLRTSGTRSASLTPACSTSRPHGEDADLRSTSSWPCHG